MKDIVQAISNLPEDMVTSEMVALALEANNPRLINVVPRRFITAELLEKLIPHASLFRRFCLAKVPSELYTQQVCDAAFQCDAANFPVIPDSFKTAAMVEQIVDEPIGGLWLLPFIPEHLWTDKVIGKGIDKISKSEREGATVERLHIFLHYVPRRIRTWGFFKRLMRSDALTAGWMPLVIPRKYQNQTYYVAWGAKDITQVPLQRIDKKVALSALNHGHGYLMLSDNRKYSELLASMMNEDMADTVVQKSPGAFEYLPKAFRTDKRLSLAVKNCKFHPHMSNLCKIAMSENLLSSQVCKAFVRRDSSCPIFPADIWDQAFVDYCVRYGKSLEWYAQMPRQFMTRQIADLVLAKSPRGIKEIPEQFISLPVAQRIYREDRDNRTYLPDQYFADFQVLTGLPEDFFGGEVSFKELKKHEVSGIYCHLGNLYFGFIKIGRYQPECRLIMRQKIAGVETPELVFDKPVSSFSQNWLEKIVAENDPSFVKPDVGKPFKRLQGSPYYNVFPIESEHGTRVWKRTFCGFAIEYCTFLANGDMLVGDTVEAVIGRVGDSQ